MGMPIQNLHSPTVGSSNTAEPADNASLTDLIARKDALESELKVLGSVLDSVSYIPPALHLSPPGFPPFLVITLLTTLHPPLTLSPPSSRYIN